MPNQTPPVAEYRCPGEDHPIARAIHLGRMARFYPGCRRCPNRDDTGQLSARRVRRLVETRPRGLRRPLFYDEGVRGTYLNDLDPGMARDVAAALGVCLQRGIGDWGLGMWEATPSAMGVGLQGQSPTESPPTTDWRRTPVVAIAGDGRPMTCELVAAVGEGLRWAGCHVVDLGPASAACLTFAIDHLQTSGGILIGNPDGRPQTVGLKFWAPGPRPLSAAVEEMKKGDLTLDTLQQTYQAGVDRPTRTSGSLRRFQGQAPYLAGLSEHYHALRPLRLMLDTSCGPLAAYLEKLTEPVACRIISCRTWLPEQVRTEKAHFAAIIHDDGETCRVLDEEGRGVAAEQVLLLLARELLRREPQGTIVLEEGTAPAVAETVAAWGLQVVSSDPRRAAVQQAMHHHGAKLGGGPSGRFWFGFADGGPPLPDALMTLTRLLTILSQSDRRFSEVLDRQAAVG